MQYGSGQRMIRRKVLKMKNGSSVVSVMVAFLILLIGLSMFSVAAVTSMDITNKSKDMRESVKEAMTLYYEGTLELEKIVTNEKYNFLNKDNKVSFKINADVIKFEYQSELENALEVSLYFFEKPE